MEFNPHLGNRAPTLSSIITKPFAPQLKAINVPEVNYIAALTASDNEDDGQPEVMLGHKSVIGQMKSR